MTIKKAIRILVSCNLEKFTYSPDMIINSFDWRAAKKCNWKNFDFSQGKEKMFHFQPSGNKSFAMNGSAASADVFCSDYRYVDHKQLVGRWLCYFAKVCQTIHWLVKFDKH